MDFFKYIQQPAKYELTEVKFDHGLKGKPSPLRGIPRSAATVAKMSAGMKGKPAWNKGKQHSAETRAKISAANDKNKKACKTPLGLFESIEAAARSHNLHPSTVRDHVRGDRRSDWHFVEKK